MQKFSRNNALPCKARTRWQRIEKSKELLAEHERAWTSDKIEMGKPD